jgi:hypothetical protein
MLKSFIDFMAEKLPPILGSGVARIVSRSDEALPKEAGSKFNEAASSSARDR